jgi:hypothetical protein
MRGDPPKESLGEDLLELVLSLYPPTALAGIALSADDAAGAVKDMIQNPEDIGFNRETLDNALDILSVIPIGRTAAKSVDLGKGLVQMAKKSNSLVNLARLLDSAGFISDRTQESEEKRPDMRSVTPIKRIQPKQIDSGDGVRSLAPRSAPKAIKRIQPKRIGPEQTRRHSPLAMRF